MDKSSDEVLIRQFKEDDYGAVSSIFANSFKGKLHYLTNLSEETIAEFLSDSGFVANRPFEGYWVAEMNDEVLGILLLKWNKQNRVKSHKKLNFIQLCLKYGFLKVIKLFIGILILNENNIRDDECYIEYIAVSSKCRGLGVGTKLITLGGRFVKDTLKLNKYSLHAASSNKKAIKLYEKLGFVIIEIENSMITRLLFNEDTWLYMVKDLNN